MTEYAPGITIVIPTQTKRRPFWEGLVDNLIDIDHAMAHAGHPRPRIHVIGDYGSNEDPYLDVMDLSDRIIRHVDPPGDHDETCCTLVPDQAFSLAGQMNSALRNLRTELVVKLDDDDWHHPERLPTQYEAWLAAAKPPWLGCHRGWFVDPSRGVLWPYNGPGTPPACALSIVRTDVAQAVPWPEQEKGSDTAWMQAIWKAGYKSAPVLNDMPPSLWRVHDDNLSGRRQPKKTPTLLTYAAVEDLVGPRWARQAWAALEAD